MAKFPPRKNNRLIVAATANASVWLSIAMLERLIDVALVCICRHLQLYDESIIL
jgi:hypothetical protein